MIAWIITSYLEIFYKHNQLFATDDKVEIELNHREAYSRSK